MPQMNTDEAAMAAAATQFDSHGAALKGFMNQIGAIGDGLMTSNIGQTGTAIQAALTRYHEAQTPLIAEIDSISQNVRETGLSYSSTDSDGHSIISATVHF